MKNWKTTLAGLLVIVGALTGPITDPSKPVGPELIAQILAGVGLIASKDHDVTGGKRKQEVDR